MRVFPYVAAQAAWIYMQNIKNKIHSSLLLLPFDRSSVPAAARRASATLSSRELKAIVAEMVG